MIRLLTAAALTSVLVVPAGAAAAEPVLPLAEVQPGLRCTASSVVRGTDVSTFDAEVIDVVDRERLERARVLMSFSGPAIDRTGIGAGFSGSPIRCADAQGTQRVLGAISESIGEYGGRVALATPIEAILAQDVEPPLARLDRARAGSLGAEARRRFPRARPLAAPLTLSGLSRPLADAFARAAAKAGRPLVTSPGSGRASQAPRPLVPGSAISVGLASGDLGLSALGTLTYLDGDRFWAFGHGLDAAGRRALFLQDAHVHTVINNPVGVPGIETYKLGSPGADIGIVSGDGLNAVAGRVGPLPPSFPLRAVARDLDTGEVRTVATRVAEEGDVGQPAGTSPLTLVAAAAVAEAGQLVQTSAPGRQAAEMCMVVRLRELREPLRACNRYVLDGSPGGLPAALVDDAVTASHLLEGYRYGVLHPESVEFRLRARRGLPLAYMERAEAPRRAVRRGGTARLRVHLRAALTGERSTVTVPVEVPRDVRRGRRGVVLTGPGPDFSYAIFEGDEGLFVFYDPFRNRDVRSLRGLRRAYERLERYDGIRAAFRERGERVPRPDAQGLEARTGRRATQEVFRDPERRISGQVRVTLRVR